MNANIKNRSSKQKTADKSEKIFHQTNELTSKFDDDKSENTSNNENYRINSISFANGDYSQRFNLKQRQTLSNFFCRFVVSLILICLFILFVYRICQRIFSKRSKTLIERIFDYFSMFLTK